MTNLAARTMPALYALAGIRASWLVFLMTYMTWFGDGVVFAAVGITAYWCWNKRAGEYMLAVGLAGTAVGNCLKNVFQVPRPWLLDEEFRIVETARSRANGYSFPSGHTQMGVGIYGSLAVKTKNRTVRILAILLCFIIPFSRMLLGVHTPLDIGVAALISVVLVFVLRNSFTGELHSERRAYVTLLIVSFISLFFAMKRGSSENATAEELMNEWDGIKAICQSIAGIGALWLGFEVDNRYTHWRTTARLPAQLLKCALGLALVGGIRHLYHFLPEGNVPLLLLIYFIAMAFGTAVWPMTFSWFEKLGQKG